MRPRPPMTPSELPSDPPRDVVIPEQHKVEYVIQRFIEDNLDELKAQIETRYAKVVPGSIAVPTTAPTLYNQAMMQEVLNSIAEIKQVLVDAGITS